MVSVVDRAAPGVIFAWRRVMRLPEINFAEAVPLCWMGVVFVPLLFSRATAGLLFDEYVERVCALGAVVAGTECHRSWRAAGAIAVGLAGMISVVATFFHAGAARSLNGNWGRWMRAGPPGRRYR